MKIGFYNRFIWCMLVVMCLTACKSHKTVVITKKTDPSKKETVSKTPDPKKDDAEEPIEKIEAVSTSIRKQYAIKLDVSESDIKNEKLYKFINEWYAVPYKYAGKDKNGIDCSGFTGVLYETIYHKKVSSSSKALHEEAKKISDSDLKEGDLVFFKINGKSVSHVGVYLQHHKFVHASTKRGVIISDLNEPYYKKYYLSAGRIK